MLWGLIASGNRRLKIYIIDLLCRGCRGLCRIDFLTSRVSHPPTMLRPRPKFPLLISMVVSLPAKTEQLKESELSTRGVCTVLRDEEEVEEVWRTWEEAEGRGERHEGGGRKEEKEGLLEEVMESLTVTRCLRIKLDTWGQRVQSSQKIIKSTWPWRAHCAALVC